MTGYKLSESAVKKVAATVRRVEQMGLPPSIPGRPISYTNDNGPFIGIAQEAISANTSGTFQFAYGTKGSETADGTDVEGYYRTSSDAEDIPDNAVCYVFWINDGWELTPVECP